MDIDSVKAEKAQLDSDIAALQAQLEGMAQVLSDLMTKIKQKEDLNKQLIAALS